MIIIIKKLTGFIYLQCHTENIVIKYINIVMLLTRQELFITI